MPIYIGDKEIATVFKGGTELDNIQVGEQQQWIGIIVTPDPSLSIQSITTNTITYRFTNNHEEEVTITYELNNSTPTANTIVVPANSFVDETLVGLNQNTEYTLYTTALEFEQIPSNVVSVTGTTVQATTANPIISSLSTSSGTSSTSVSFQVQNEDSENVTLYYELNDTSPDQYNNTITGSGSVGLNIDSLSPSTNYTLYVYAIVDGYIASDVISQSFTTPQLRTETPSIVVTSETHTSVNFRITNNDSSTATIKYDINDGTPDAVTITLGAGQSSNRSWSGLTDGTGYTIYATAQASGEVLSSVGSRSFTTDRYTTASPTISIVGTTDNSINYRVTNNDNNTVTLRYEINDSTPDRYSFNVAPGASITYNRTGLSTGQTYTIYARAYAPRENSSPTVSLQAVAAKLGPGPTTLVGGNSNTGFFGVVTQAEMGLNMVNDVINFLNIPNARDRGYSGTQLFKFVHKGKIKYIPRENILDYISHQSLKSAFQAVGGNIYSGVNISFGGNTYNLRVMRGWGQVSGTHNACTTPDLENGPLYVVNENCLSTDTRGTGGNRGVNWPNDNSPWNENSPNEWNTLLFPIHVNGSTQTQTSGVPNWENYSDDYMGLSFGATKTICQENYANQVLSRGIYTITPMESELSYSYNSTTGFRPVLELL